MPTGNKKRGIHTRTENSMVFSSFFSSFYWISHSHTKQHLIWLLFSSMCFTFLFSGLHGIFEHCTCEGVRLCDFFFSLCLKVCACESVCVFMPIPASVPNTILKETKWSFASIRCCFLARSPAAIKSISSPSLSLYILALSLYILLC